MLVFPQQTHFVFELDSQVERRVHLATLEAVLAPVELVGVVQVF